MYCDGCGAALNPGAKFCTGCGKAIVGAASGVPVAPVPVNDDRVRRHIQPVAILWLVNGVLRLGEVAWLMIFGSMFLPWMRGWPGQEPSMPFGWSLESLLLHGMYAIGITMAVFGAVHLVLAWGLFEREPWARILGIVVAILALLRFPFGTALGAYTLWVLLPESSAREYARMSGGDVHAARVST